LIEDSIHNILQLIESIWSRVQVPPEFINLLRRSLVLENYPKSDTKRSRLVYIPELCCQAAGGEAFVAEPLNAAWYLFYMAAHLMDCVEDGDYLGEWLQPLGPGAALNIASGLYFTASQALQRLNFLPLDQTTKLNLIGTFYECLFQMTSGQNDDLLLQEIDLSSYWRIVTNKSGVFFSLGCWSGARLATDDPTILEGYRLFGQNLGILKQIKDDMEEVLLLNPSNVPQRSEQLVKIRRSLPIVYALEVIPPDQKVWLIECLDNAPQNQESADEIVKLLDHCGAALYVSSEIHRYRNDALTALQRVSPLEPYHQFLIDLLG
jgi:hypothetical protein